MLKSGILQSFRSKSLTVTVVFAVMVWSSSVVIGRSGLPVQPGALEYAGTFALRDNDPNLTGEGVTIAAVCRSMTYDQGLPQEDYQINTSHDCFSNSKISFADAVNAEAGISSHATAIGAILAGSDPNGFFSETGYFQYEGAAPEAEVDVYEFWRFIGNYVFGGKEFEADVLTFSVGLAFEDWWTRGIDNIIEESGLITVASVGNGSEAYDPLLYPGSNANVIGVGVVDSVASTDIASGLGHFSLPFSVHSSTGPTNDGRGKPDIVAPGNCLVPIETGKNGYDISGDYTSFAAPVVSGSAGLLVQKAKDSARLQGALSNNNGNCVIKAILLTSADKLPGWHKGYETNDDDHRAPLDYTQGAGVINSLAAANLLDAGQSTPPNAKSSGWDNNNIQNDPYDEKVYGFGVDDGGEQFITATLAWNLRYENEYPFEKALEQSDLRLELWGVGADEKWILLDHSDSKNDNVEHIYYRVDPRYGGYELVVSSNGDNEKRQKYAIAWSVTTPRSKDIYWYDLNGDGKVDSVDVGIAIENVLVEDNGGDVSNIGDVNLDGVIDIDDIDMLMSQR